MKMKKSNLSRGIRVLCAIRVRTTSRPGRIRGRAAFTLLEMAIVLAILALVTHIAVVRLVDDSYKPRLARRQLDDIHAAICGKPGALDPAGQPTWTGFVADMGRLPTSLEELWKCPEGESGRVLSPPDGEDEDIRLFCGWNGPYVKPTRDGRLLDPWGNPYVLATNDTSLACVWTYGSDGVRDPENPNGLHESALDICITNDVSTTLSIDVIFWKWDSSGTNSVREFVSTHDFDGSTAYAHVYSPDVGDGHCEIISVPQISSAVVNACASFTIADLTPGPRVLRIRVDDNKRGIPHPVVLRPGANRVVFAQEIIE